MALQQNKKDLIKEKKEGLLKGADEKWRCFWVGDFPLYQRYHDEEWGRPIHCDQKIFEQLSLEIFQSGLSWYTVLKKREDFRRSFMDFDFYKLADYNGTQIEKLATDKKLIRHRKKIFSVVHNARKAIDLVKEYGSLEKYFWSFAPEDCAVPVMDLIRYQENLVPSYAHNLTKDLKKRGWLFVGPKVCYAFMQAIGMVNDHIEGCSFREQCHSSKSLKQKEKMKKA